MGKKRSKKSSDNKSRDTKSQPSDTKPDDTNSQPSDTKPGDTMSQSSDTQSSNTKSTDKKSADNVSIDKKSGNNISDNNKSSDVESSDVKSSDQKSSDEKSSDKVSDEKSSDNKSQSSDHKPSGIKPRDIKSGDRKSGDSKSGDIESSDKKSTDTKFSNKKPSDTKSSQSKSTDKEKGPIKIKGLAPPSVYVPKLVAQSSTRRRIHENPDLCRVILSAAVPTLSLEIKKSTIDGAGSGLFTTVAVDAGRDIFRSRPLVKGRDPNVKDVCDWCLERAEGWIDALCPEVSAQFNSFHLKAPKMMICGGCKSARYCSEACQRVAWRAFHKLECEKVLSKTPDMDAVTLALYRLLLMKKEGIFTKLQWDALFELESHAIELGKAMGEGIIKVVAEWGKRMGHVFSGEDVMKLYCILLTNSVTMRPAEADVSYGVSLDIALSMLNHNCEPNAHVYFDGSLARVRSLKDIPAGGEITVSYTDVCLDVLPRRKILKSTKFINCTCDLCIRELHEHRKAGGTCAKKRRRILAQQTDLLATINVGSYSFYTIFKESPEAQKGLIAKFVTALSNCKKRGYCRGKPWPDSLEPLPSGRMELAHMLRNSGNYILSMHYALISCLGQRHRFGRSFVHCLFELTRIMVQTMNHLAPKRKVPPGFPSREELLWAAKGFLTRLHTLVPRVFGMDNRYAAIVRGWTRAIFTDAGVPEEANISGQEMVDRFKKGQKALLAWAGIEKGGLSWKPDEYPFLEDAYADLPDGTRMLKSCTEGEPLPEDCLVG